MLNPFAGSWLYRSFHNRPGPIQAIADLLFGEGELEIQDTNPGKFEAVLSFGTNVRLNARGSYQLGNPFSARFQGVGIAGTPTEGWVYDYIGYLVPDWPHGAEQRSAIVGSVIRSAPHSGGAAAPGYVASFIAVKR